MSPEHSETDNSDDAEDNSSSEEDEEAQRKKKIVVRPLSWRSGHFREQLASLDRKWNRRSTTRARAMAKPRCLGEVLQRDAPEGIPSFLIARQ